MYMIEQMDLHARPSHCHRGTIPKCMIGMLEIAQLGSIRLASSSEGPPVRMSGSRARALRVDDIWGGTVVSTAASRASSRSPPGSTMQARQVDSLACERRVTTLEGFPIKRANQQITRHAL